MLLRVFSWFRNRNDIWWHHAATVMELIDTIFETERFDVENSDVASLPWSCAIVGDLWRLPSFF